MTVVKTIGAGAGLGVTPDYSDINGWDSYLNALGAFSEDQTGRVLWASSANELSVSATQVLDGSVPGGYSILLEAGDSNGNAGGSFRDNANKLTNALRYNASNGACIKGGANFDNPVLRVSDPKTTVRYLQILAAQNYNRVFEAVTDNTTIDSCIFQMNLGYLNVLWLAQAPSITNCLLLVSNTNYTTVKGINWAASVAGGVMMNCTVVNLDAGNTSGYGFWKGYTTSSSLTNVAFYGWGVNRDYGNTTTGMTASYCATDNSDANSILPGSNHQYSLTGSNEWESLTIGSEDFRLKSTSAACKDNGTSTGAPSVDIVGQSRSGNTDIGLWEYQSAPPVGGEVQAWNMVVRLGA